MASTAIWTVPIAWGLAMVPHFAKVVFTAKKGKADNSNPRDKEASQKGMSAEDKRFCDRLAAAHENQLESLGYYAASVALAVAVKVPEQTLVKYTTGYIAARTAYVFAYAAPQIANGMVRSITFVGAMACTGLLYGASAAAVANSNY